jgi:hypothetical protein
MFFWIELISIIIIMEKIFVKKSSIHHSGIFNINDIKENNIIGLLIYFKFYCIPYKTTIGKFINHSKNNNCKCVKINDIYYIKSIKYIQHHSELTLDYNDTPWFILGEWSI